MKILVLNGSPRKGNTLTCINAFVEGASAKHDVEVVNVYDLNVAPCKGCNACQMMNGCALDRDDDSNPIVDKVVAADMIVFATPVYWWGMTAQLKMILDKCYCRGLHLKGKKAATIVVGADTIQHPQYRIIQEQFDCISGLLAWDFAFHAKFSASAPTDLAGEQEALDAMKAYGESL